MPMNLHLLHTGPLSVNTFIVPLFENKVFVVDSANCAFSRDEGSLVSYLNSNSLEPVAAVLTHGHFDHVSGLPSLKKSFPDIKIAIHKSDSEMIGEKSRILQEKSLSQMGFTAFLPFVSNLPGVDGILEDKKTLADTFSDCNFDEKLKSALSDWKILHTPGHTEGSVCLYNKKELTLISGDTLFYHSWGRTDLYGGDENKIHQSLFKIHDYCDENTKVYPGHDMTGFLLGEN
ncbi:MAG: MBL fold metallo-hydrolase [Treponema sp.]|nr:MBL fold metallo-hydrolase [Treponema sp.]